MFPIWLMLALAADAQCDGELRTHGVENLAQGAAIEASSSAGQRGAKYGVDSANDGDTGTWWASAKSPTYPVSVTLTFAQPETIDCLALVQADNPTIYTNWKTVRIAFSDGSSLEETFEDNSAPKLVRFEQRAAEWVKVEIVDPYDAEKYYVTLREIMAFRDPDGKVAVKMPPAAQWKTADVTPQRRDTHPCVYITPEDVARARTRIETEDWARNWFEGVRRQADEWVSKEDEWIASILPEPGACFAYGVTACPICRASWGQWGGARCSFDNPGHVTCANGHVLPDAEHPDPGTGYEGPDGRIHYFVGSYNAWVVETLQFKALRNLAYAYTLTGDERYAEKAAFILDRLADLYPSCDKGSWDYPSDPPSGRFCRPWYQVARVLIHYVDWYDQVFHSPALDRPSVRQGLSRRENIELNLLQNGATYCYTQSLKGRLHNGEADYIRGALAVGCCLGIPWYIDWAYDGPYGILNLVRNNVDRDGRYFETSVMYADHTRDLYLTFAEPLLNYRSGKYPDGINLYDDRQFQSFYVLPELSFLCIGKEPRFGDSGPDTARSFLPDQPTSAFDYRLAERLYARVSTPEDKARFASLLHLLSGGDIEKTRVGQAEMPWLLFHGAEPPDRASADLDLRLRRRIAQSDFFGQKGIGILRAGGGADAQAALVRFGPTLNHGHYDDLNLSYYALGYEVTYDLGYGLGSTHTQVGWSRQTASHNLVLVDETSQGAAGSGTGGSLHHFADLPGLKLMEASSESSYVQQGVTTYRRLLALIGEGPEAYLVDVFRVAGGAQHDYLFHSLGDQAEFEGVTLGEPEPGSLAGPQIEWGAKQLNDGDMEGFPNKPYWNPPPGNGLGFVMEPQRAKADGEWSATWPLPSGDAFLRLTMLGQPGTEVISAWAPGILPRHPQARYAIARRRSESGPLSSAFVAILEPYGRRMAGDEITALDISREASTSAGELKYIDGINVLLHKALERNDEVRWPFEVRREDDYVLFLDHYQSTSYGQVQLLVDAAEVGDPVVGTGEQVRAAPLSRVGKLHLAAGNHEAALRQTADDGAGHYWFGLRAMWLVPANLAETTDAVPFIQDVRPLTCEDTSGPLEPAGVLVTLDEAEGVRDLIAVEGHAGRPRSFGQGQYGLDLQGSFAHVRMRAGQPEEVHLIDSTSLTIGDLELACAAAHLTGTVRDVNKQEAIIETEAHLPADGRLDGQVILFENEAYSRNAAHRIARVEALPDGSRIVLESPSLILGTGILEDDPDSDTELVSLLPHEYARSDSVTGTQFFSGKRIEGDGFQTNIVRTGFGQLMSYQVESTAGMSAGDEFVVCDVQAGDTFRIPTVAYVKRVADGTFSGQATTEVVVILRGREVARIMPVAGRP
jgi:hypothetical protein